MQKNERSARARRVRRGITVALLIAAAASAMFLFPRGLRDPERSAGEFLEVLIQAPSDVERLRNVARVAADTDPQTLLQGLSTGVTMSFLQARQAQGVSQTVSVVSRRQSAPQHYAVTVRVSDDNAADAVSLRYFIVQFEQRDGGDWRIVSVRMAD